MTTLTKIRLDGVEYDLGGGSFTQEQADWAEADTTDVSFIKNKPTLASVATSGLYSDLTGTPSLGSLASKSSITHSEVSDWSTATSSFLTEHQDISGLLAKTGGTMTGAVTRNGTLAQSGDTSGSISIQNGTSAAGGGGIWMYGASNANAGKVRLQAYDSTNKKYCALDANGDGTLTWCGNSVATDNNVVHLTGTEDITGKKTIASNLNIKNANLTRGATPSSNNWIYMTFSGSGGDATNQRFGTVASGVYNTGAVRLYLEAYKNTANTTTNAQLAVTYPAEGDPYASAPSTPDKAVDTEIVTADFLNGVANQAIGKANVDLNTIVDQGVYYVSTSTANADDHHYPVGTNGILVVFRNDSTAKSGFCQQWFRRTGTAGTNDHMTYVREAGSGGTGTWGAWTQILTSKQLTDNGGTIATKTYVDNAIASITDADSTGY
jgi:hypothetical protein